MTTFDYAVLAIIGLSILLSMMRGFVREVLALASWAVAFFVAKIYTLQLAPLLPSTIPSDALKFLAAFIILFLATLLICSLLAIALSQIFKKAGLDWVDRLLGALFGAARGLMIIGVLVFLAGLTDMPKDARWRNAMFSAPLEAMVNSILPWFPEDIAKHIKYD
ncbi:colicin V production protein [Methylovorus sp. MM2]|uniref:CvpA family protein n=1 Tax=Methylovorus sp. MM2 TaxID=1848038 RepID=UPI0007E23597|nr:CvpA family protein [Methylovorus sp. MM2]OAM52844.1 colicin V production protein [Methylovorus sp. MM2]